MTVTRKREAPIRFFHKLSGEITVCDRETFILKLAAGKMVLHLGCVDTGVLEGRISTDTWLHEKLTRVATRVVGVDIDRVGIESLRSRGIRDLFIGDAEHLETSSLPDIDYDVVVAGEVIEHLANFGLFLTGVRRIMRPNTLMVISTPNALRLENFLLAAAGWEMCHPDHYSCFSPFTFENTLTRTGFRIVERHVYPLIPVKFDRSRQDGLRARIGRLIFGIFSQVTRTVVLRLCPYFAEGLLFVVAV